MNILIEARVQTADSHGEKYTYRSAPEGTNYKQAGIEGLTALDNIYVCLFDSGALYAISRSFPQGYCGVENRIDFTIELRLLCQEK